MSVHVLLPFLPDMDDDPDFNRADLERAIQANWQIQRVVEAWLRGQIAYEAVLDALADQGIDAWEWEEYMSAAVDRLILTPGVHIDDRERIIEGLHPEDSRRLILPED